MYTGVPTLVPDRAPIELLWVLTLEVYFISPPKAESLVFLVDSMVKATPGFVIRGDYLCLFWLNSSLEWMGAYGFTFYALFNLKLSVVIGSLVEVVLNPALWVLEVIFLYEAYEVWIYLWEDVLPPPPPPPPEVGDCILLFAYLIWIFEVETLSWL